MMFQNRGDHSNSLNTSPIGRVKNGFRILTALLQEIIRKQCRAQPRASGFSYRLPMLASCLDGFIPHSSLTNDPPQFEMLIFSSILIYVMNQIAAQLESAMGSNLDEQRKETLPQCPGEWQWACRNGECIARYDTCDGIPQCSDGSDEWNCDQWRQKQDHEQNNPGKDATRFAASTQPSTTTTAVAEGQFAEKCIEMLFHDLWKPLQHF
ncbi:hypothetical protein KIN20_023129 [Parelaphostrongylus tenuis]|uniref:Low-density lipoprotein receptor domain class A n=1 Tax=Parelaphostrongylus tenuis TaxID=148309 RepID=A0AAD5MV43_PARTN|nr:hypothetical protein KIN20_023129 [Parelaphostrongylus tenuis]